jgi:ribosomal protein L7/L12
MNTKVTAIAKVMRTMTLEEASELNEALNGMLSLDVIWRFAQQHSRSRIVMDPTPLQGPNPQTIQAIKVVREIAGLGLADAKRLVDQARASGNHVVVWEGEASVAEELVKIAQRVKDNYTTGFEPHPETLKGWAEFKVEL